jgi:hypothetical protein
MLFCNKWYQSQRFQDPLPGRLSGALPGSIAQRRDQHLQSCGISFVEIKATGGS